MVSDIHHIVPTDGKVNGIEVIFLWKREILFQKLLKMVLKEEQAITVNYSGTVLNQ